MAYALLIALVIAALGASMAVTGSVRRAFARAMAHRAPLDEADFAALFPGAEESAIAVRRALAAVLPGDVRLVRPGDRMVADLRIDALDGLNPHVVVMTLERRFSIRIPEARAAGVRTVQELIALVQSLRAGP